jgi:hypothetical protein
MIDSVRQHLLHVQQRMKHQADKKRTERVFAVDDLVFLKLQPYVQSSIVRTAKHKLSFKFLDLTRSSRRLERLLTDWSCPLTAVYTQCSMCPSLRSSFRQQLRYKLSCLLLQPFYKCLCRFWITAFVSLAERQSCKV